MNSVPLTVAGGGVLPIVVSGEPGWIGRITGIARTRVGVSSYQSGDDESTIAAVSKASVTWLRHSGRTSWPTKSPK